VVPDLRLRTGYWPFHRLLLGLPTRAIFKQSVAPQPSLADLTLPLLIYAVAEQRASIIEATQNWQELREHE
jgi:hypothetical protein